LYGLGLLLITAVMVFQSVDRASRLTHEDQGAASLSKIELYQVIAPAILIAVLWFQLIVLSLAAAALCGPAIIEDRKAGTLATLLTTPLSVPQIVIGKLAGRVSELLLLMLIALPIVLCLRVLGGVDLPTLLVGFGLTLACALTTACVSLFASARARSAPTGILAGLLLTAFIFAAPMIILSLVTVVNRTWYVALPRIIPGLPNEHLAYATLPPAVLGMISVQTLSGFSPLGGSWSPLLVGIVSIAWMLLVSAFFLLLTFVSLRGVMRREGEGLVALRKSKGKRPRHTPPPPPPVQSETPTEINPGPPGVESAIDAASPRRRKRGVHNPGGSSREVSDKPVLWREASQPMISQRSGRIALLGLFTALCVIVSMIDGLGGAHVPMTVLFTVLLLVAAMTLPCNAVAGEREGRTLEVLLTTPMSARQIVWSKVFGALRRLVPFAAAVAAYLLLVGVFGKQTAWVLEWIGGFLPPRLQPEIFRVKTLSVWGALLAGLSAAGAIFFVTCSAVFFSTVFRKTTVAAVANTVFVCAIWLGTPFLHLISTDFRRSSIVLFLIQLLEPVYLVGEIINGFSRNNTSPLSLLGRIEVAWPPSESAESAYAYSFGHKAFELFGTSLLVCVSTAVYVTAGCLLAAWAARKLRTSARMKP
jgi:ABC-type transport system involved in multi-copper enzyme maturation permease subunit